MPDSSAPHTEPKENSGLLDSGTAGYRITLLIRAALGAAFGALAFTSVASAGPNMPQGMLMAAALCGCGIGISLDRRISKIFGRLIALRVSILSALAASVVIYISESDTITLFGAALLGIGLQTEWGSLSEFARSLTSATNRWQRMRLFHVSFFLGFTIACVAGSFSVPCEVAILVLAISAAVSVLAIDKTSADKTEINPVDPVNHQHAGLPESAATEDLSHAVTEADGDNRQDPETDCDAVECCGGTSREIIPTPAWLGSTLGATAGLLLFGLLIQLLATVPEPLLFAFGLSCVVSHLLVTTTAPQTGYVVIVVGFAFVSAGICGVHFATDESTNAHAPTLFLAAFFITGTITGLNAMLGELFSDCGSERKRTDVLSNSAFAAAATLVLIVLLPGNEFPLANVVWVLIFPVILGCVRLIPGPVVSHLGRDDLDPEDEAERQEIVAAMKQ